MAAKKSSMNPKLLLIGVVVLVVVGVGAFMVFGNKSAGDESASSGSNAFTSIKDALSKSLSLQCEYTDSEGRSSVVYIKNGAMRGDITGGGPGESGSMINKDGKMYFWNEEGGYVMTITEGDDMGDYESSDSQSAGEDFMEEIEEYKESCKPAVVSDSLFTPPSDVQFTDMSQMMNGQMSEEEMQRIMEQYQTSE